MEQETIEIQTAQGVETISNELLIREAFIDRATEYVKQAKKSILICAYDWRWYVNSPEKSIQKLNIELFKKSDSGVQVRAILDKADQAKILKSYKIDARILPDTMTMHTKAILIDEKVLILGSHNLTERGTAENHEISLHVRDPAVCLAFYDYFTALWQNYGV